MRDARKLEKKTHHHVLVLVVPLEDSGGPLLPDILINGRLQTQTRCESVGCSVVIHPDAIDGRTVLRRLECGRDERESDGKRGGICITLLLYSDGINSNSVLAQSIGPLVSADLPRPSDVATQSGTQRSWGNSATMY